MPEPKIQITLPISSTDFLAEGHGFIMSGILRYLENHPNFTSALSAVTSTVIALAALVVSVISLLLAKRTLELQHRHNVLSVRPLASIARADYEERLTVKIVNNGPGPMIILKSKMINGTQDKEDLIDWMPDLPHGLYWETFVKDIKGRSVAPEGEIVLLQLSGDTGDKKFLKGRDDCRRMLSKIKVEITFTDIYGTNLEAATRDLSWFGRHFPAEKV